MLSSVIPPFNGDGSQFVVNIYIYSHTHFQECCIRIRSLNTFQFDELIDRNKVTFPSQASVVHACNPSYLGGRDQEDRDSKPTQMG
jgi:hypothetical protein